MPRVSVCGLLVIYGVQSTFSLRSLKTIGSGDILVSSLLSLSFSPLFSYLLCSRVVNLPGWFQSLSLAFTAQHLIATGTSALKITLRIFLVFIEIDLTLLSLFFFSFLLKIVVSFPFRPSPAISRMAN